MEQFFGAMQMLPFLTTQNMGKFLFQSRKILQIGNMQYFREQNCLKQPIRSWKHSAIPYLTTSGLRFVQFMDLQRSCSKTTNQYLMMRARESVKLYPQAQLRWES